MKQLFSLTLAFTLFVGSVIGASPTIYQAGSVGSGDVQIKPQATPTSSTVVASTDAYLKQVTVTNTTSGALTFTLSDRQGTPVDFISAVSFPGNSVTVIPVPVPYWLPNGFTVVASGAGLNYSAAWRQ
jgi:hypothetical protein